MKSWLKEQKTKIEESAAAAIVPPAAVDGAQDSTMNGHESESPAKDPPRAESVVAAEAAVPSIEVRVRAMSYSYCS